MPKTLARKRPKTAAQPPPKPSLRLEWRDPAALADNPQNWRTHPEPQTAALAAVIDEVGWAGACLFNEATGRLIDGHARKKVAAARGDGKVPVLVGSWTPAQEAMILATLDPLAAMAGADDTRLLGLLKDVQSADADLQQMLADLARSASLPQEADGKEFDESCAADVQMATCPKCGHEFPK